MKRTIWLCRAISDRTFENFFATLPIRAYIRVLLPDGAARIFFSYLLAPRPELEL